LHIPSNVTNIWMNAFWWHNMWASDLVIECSLPTLGIKVFNDSWDSWFSNPVTCTP
jgi:hypothetical protein